MCCCFLTGNAELTEVFACDRTGQKCCAPKSAIRDLERQEVMFNSRRNFTVNELGQELFEHRPGSDIGITPYSPSVSQFAPDVAYGPQYEAHAPAHPQYFKAGSSYGSPVNEPHPNYFEQDQIYNQYNTEHNEPEPNSYEEALYLQQQQQLQHRFQQQHPQNFPTNQQHEEIHDQPSDHYQQYPQYQQFEEYSPSPSSVYSGQEYPHPDYHQRPPPHSQDVRHSSQSQDVQHPSQNQNVQQQFYEPNNHPEVEVDTERLNVPPPISQQQPNRVEEIRENIPLKSDAMSTSTLRIPSPNPSIHPVRPEPELEMKQPVVPHQPDQPQSFPSSRPQRPSLIPPVAHSRPEEQYRPQYTPSTRAPQMTTTTGK